MRLQIKTYEGRFNLGQQLNLKWIQLRELKIAALNIPKMDEIYVMKIIASNISIGTELAIKIIAHKLGWRQKIKDGQMMQFSHWAQVLHWVSSCLVCTYKE